MATAHRSPENMSVGKRTRGVSPLGLRVGCCVVVVAELGLLVSYRTLAQFSGVCRLATYLGLRAWPNCRRQEARPPRWRWTWSRIIIPDSLRPNLSRSCYFDEPVPANCCRGTILGCPANAHRACRGRRPAFTNIHLDRLTAMLTPKSSPPADGRRRSRRRLSPLRRVPPEVLRRIVAYAFHAGYY